MNLRKVFISFLFIIWGTISYGDSYLVIHGLNLSPEMMGEISNLLKENGHEVSLLRLTGHDPNDYTSLLNITKEQWVDDFENAYFKLKGKKHLVAYSLGGLVSLYSASKNDKIVFESVTLLAPAIKPTWVLNIARLALNLGMSDVPSLAPVNERVHKSASLKAYLEILEMSQELSELKERAKFFNKMKASVLMDPDDMLISWKRTKDWINENSLTEWSLIELDSTRGVQHMIVRSEYQTSESWNKLKKTLIRN